jgi:hypothetical protein
MNVLNERSWTDAVTLGGENEDRLRRGWAFSWAGEQVDKDDIFL